MRFDAQIAHIVDVRHTSSTNDLDAKTGSACVKLLEDVHLVFLLPPWRATLGSRLQKRPKMHRVDCGLASRQMRMSPEKATRSATPECTPGTDVPVRPSSSERSRNSCSWTEVAALCGHGNHVDAHEVDRVIERENGRIAGSKVKAAQTSEGPEFKGFRGACLCGTHGRTEQ